LVTYPPPLFCFIVYPNVDARVIMEQQYPCVKSFFFLDEQWLVRDVFFFGFRKCTRRKAAFCLFSPIVSPFSAFFPQIVSGPSPLTSSCFSLLTSFLNWEDYLSSLLLTALGGENRLTQHPHHPMLGPSSSCSEMSLRSKFFLSLFPFFSPGQISGALVCRGVYARNRHKTDPLIVRVTVLFCSSTSGTSASLRWFLFEFAFLTVFVTRHFSLKARGRCALYFSAVVATMSSSCDFFQRGDFLFPLDMEPTPFLIFLGALGPLSRVRGYVSPGTHGRTQVFLAPGTPHLCQSALLLTFVLLFTSSS